MINTLLFENAGVEVNAWQMRAVTPIGGEPATVPWLPIHVWALGLLGLTLLSLGLLWSLFGRSEALSNTTDTTCLERHPYH